MHIELRYTYVHSIGYLVCFFFFQAEDGIRDADVTGVQTCALPICFSTFLSSSQRRFTSAAVSATASPKTCGRSEERRVGKSVDLGGRRIIKKKKKNDYKKRQRRDGGRPYRSDAREE